MPKLTCTENGVRRTVELTGDLLVLGTDSACGVVLTDPKVSPVHCEFRRGANGWRVVDLESRDGTSVNGDFVNQRVLSEGDVVQVGDVQCIVSGLAAPAAPLAQMARPVAAPPTLPVALPVAKPVAPQRGRAPARGEARQGRDGADAAEDGRPQRVRKKDNTTTVMLVGAGLVVFALFVLVIRPNYSATRNQQVAQDMRKLEKDARWAEMLDRAKDADPDDGLGYGEVKELIAIAEDGIRGNASKVVNEASLAEWNALQTWFQKGDFKEVDAYRGKLDDYLRKYADNDGIGTTQARKDRAKRFGSAVPDGWPVNGVQGWKWIAADADALMSSGKFGDALVRLESWWRDNSVAASAVTADYEKKRGAVADSASKWVDGEIAKSRFALERGEKTKARNILKRAAENIGIPELAKRAEAELSKI